MFACHAAGIRPAWTAEIDPDARAVLSAREAVRNYGDIRDAMACDPPPVDILEITPPCTSFSPAGRRAGLADEQGRLLLRACEAVHDIRAPGPRGGRGVPFVAVENTPELLKDPAMGHAVGRLAGWDDPATLAELGARVWPEEGSLVGPKRRVAWCKLHLTDFGIPQTRTRLFIVSVRKDIPIDPRKLLTMPADDRRSPKSVDDILSHGCSEAKRAQKLSAPRCRELLERCRRKGVSLDPVVEQILEAQAEGRDDEIAELAHWAPTLVFKPCLGRNGRGPASREVGTVTAQPGSSGKSDTAFVVVAPEGVRFFLMEELERLQGLPAGWTAGLSATARCRLIGNACPPPFLEMIFRRARHVLVRTTGKRARAATRRVAAQHEHTRPAPFSPSSAIELVKAERGYRGRCRHASKFGARPPPPVTLRRSCPGQSACRLCGERVGGPSFGPADCHSVDGCGASR